MIFNFREFLLEEVRLEDVLKTDSVYINSFKKTGFNSSERFKTNIMVKLDDDNMMFRILWNNNSKHDLIKRIKERTSLKSTEEFNELFEKSVNELFDEHFALNIKSYALFFVEYNFSIIVEVKIEDKSIKVATILPGTCSTNVGKIIHIKSVL
jgi:hypothetical protein